MPADPWTGYRSGALVVDTSTNRIGVSVAFDGERYTLKGTKGGPHEWTADKRAVRLATTEERATLGLGPWSI
ncbi:hypothetical protein ACFY1P_06080 [Streptomyces sp. NPDC001407]|uniref:hypothetical protein n=1 Tax=unclassified Streptomyces TaxID=2593676 RepID=UPI0033FC289A